MPCHSDLCYVVHPPNEHCFIMVFSLKTKFVVLIYRNILHQSLITSTLKSERSLFKCQFSLLPAKGDDKNNALFTVSIFQTFHTQKTEDSKNTHLLFSMKNFEN